MQATTTLPPCAGNDNECPNQGTLLGAGRGAPAFCSDHRAEYQAWNRGMA